MQFVQRQSNVPSLIVNGLVFTHTVYSGRCLRDRIYTYHNLDSLLTYKRIISWELPIIRVVATSSYQYILYFIPSSMY